MIKRWFFLSLWLWLVCWLVITGCSTTSRKLTIAIPSELFSEGVETRFAPLRSHLERELGMPVAFVALDNAALVGSLKSNRAQVAWLHPEGFLAARKTLRLRPLVEIHRVGDSKLNSRNVLLVLASDTLLSSKPTPRPHWIAVPDTTPVVKLLLGKLAFVERRFSLDSTRKIDVIPSDQSRVQSLLEHHHDAIVIERNSIERLRHESPALQLDYPVLLASAPLAGDLLVANDGVSDALVGQLISALRNAQESDLPPPLGFFSTVSEADYQFRIIADSLTTYSDSTIPDDLFHAIQPDLRKLGQYFSDSTTTDSGGTP